MTTTDPGPRFSSSDKRWIGAQFILLLAAMIGGIVEYLLVGRTYSIGSVTISLIAGVVLASACVAVLAKAAQDLGANLTAAPTPVSHNTLVDSGIYGVVRHPMYLGLLLGLAGYALVFGSATVVAVLLLLIPFFAAKASHEERLLRARVHGYDDYTRRTPHRFIPFIY